MSRPSETAPDRSPAAHGVLYAHGPDDDTAFSELQGAIDDASHDFQLSAVDSIEGATETIETKSIDCVVTDLVLADGDGFDLIEAIRMANPTLPIVLYTDDGDEATAARALQCGVDGYVRPSADGSDALLETVAGVAVANRSTWAMPDDVDEVAVLHAAADVLGRDKPMDDRLAALAYVLVDAIDQRQRTVARIQAGDDRGETVWPADATVVYTTSITTAEDDTVRIEIGRTGATPAPIPASARVVTDAVAGVVETQLDACGGTAFDDGYSELLRSFLDSSSVVFSIKSLDGTYELVNGSFETVYGIDESVAVGKTDQELFSSERASQLQESDQRALDSGDVIEIQETIEVNGSWRPFLTIKAPLLDGDGDPRRLLTISSDLSEHSQLLFEREEILDRMTDAFLAVDEDWRFTFVNQRAVELLDRPEESLLGTELWEAFPEAVDSIFEEQYRHAMAEQEVVEFESHFGPLGRTFEINAYPSDSGLSIFARDVTDERATEAELEQSVQALHRLYKVASQPDIEFEEKLDRILALGNDRLDIPYGFLTRITESRQLIVASSGDHELLQPGEACALEESYCRKTIDTNGILAVHNAIEDGWADDTAYDVFELGSYIGGKVVVDGELYGTLCFASTTPRDASFTDSEQAFVELASRWVSYELEQRQYQDRLERQNDRLEKFASTVSHDLRNPLNVARGHLENAAESHPDDESIDEATVSLDRAFSIIDDVLAFARLGEDVVDDEPAALAAIARHAWDCVDNQVATLTVEDGLWEVDCDPARVQSLFENLFRNATDHGPNDVTVAVGPLENGFYVEDDGPGFGAVDRDRLFEFGYTTAAEGTGFGLAIAAEVAHAHGWSIDAVDGSDGARFEITGIDDVRSSPAEAT